MNVFSLKCGITLIYPLLWKPLRKSMSMHRCQYLRACKHKCCIAVFSTQAYCNQSVFGFGYTYFLGCLIYVHQIVLQINK